jgi:hypothetical protein
MQNADPGALAEHPNDKIIREIRRRMGNQAELLRYLPLDHVRIEQLSEDIRPASAIPYQMHFGEIGELSDAAGQVRILLRIGPMQGPPEVRYHILSRNGALTRTISAARSCQEVVPDTAFQCIAEGRGIDEVKARAVARYYFLARKVDLRTMWPINDKFISELVSACQVAERSFGRPIAREHTKDDVAAQAPSSHVPHLPHPEIIEQVRYESPEKKSSHQDSSKDTYEGRWMNSISYDSSRKRRYSGPYVYQQPLDKDGPDQAALRDSNKENVRGRSSKKPLAISFSESNDTRRHTFPDPNATQDVRSTHAPLSYRANEMVHSPLMPKHSSDLAGIRPNHHLVCSTAHLAKISC